MASSRRLAANVFSGVAFNVFRICVQIVMLPLMARLLGPEEMGLYQLAMPMLSFVLLLADAGLGDSLAREKSESTLVWSSAFWGLLIGGLILSLGVYATSFFFAAAAHQPRLPQVMLPLCLTLFLVCATVIPQARLLREGNLMPGTIGDFIATLTGAVAGVVLAYKGYGVWALVTQFVSTSVIRTIILNWLRPFVPRFEFDFKALFAHSDIGGAILGGRLIDTGGRQIESTQVTRTLGDGGLGTYGYANQIGRFFSDAVANTMWANLYYVAINKTPEETIKHYIYSHRIFALLIFPSVVLLALAMPALVPILLGSKWAGSTYSIMVILVTAPFSALGGLSSAVLFAWRKFKITMIAAIAFTTARVMVAFVAYRYGVLGLCIGVGTINLIYYVYVVGFISPVIGNKPSELIRAVAGPIIAAAVTGVCFYYLHALLPSGLTGLSGPAWLPTLAWLIVAGGASFLLYPVALFLVDNRATRADISAARAIIQRKSHPA